MPRFPGVTSALGCVIADIRHDRVRTVNVPLETLDEPALQALVAAETQACRAVVDAAGLTMLGVHDVIEADMHYAGQSHTVAVPLPVAEIVTRDMLLRAFEAAYQAAFGRVLSGVAVRLVNLRVAAIGPRPPSDFAALAPGPEALMTAADRGTRPVWFGGWRQASIHDRLALPVGAKIEGPAILGKPDATTVIDPSLVATVDLSGNVITRL